MGLSIRRLQGTIEFEYRVPEGSDEMKEIAPLRGILPRSAHVRACSRFGPGMPGPYTAP